MYRQNVEPKRMFRWYRKKSMTKVYQRKGRIKMLGLLKHRRNSNQRD